MTSLRSVDWVEIALLVIALLIGVLAVVAAVVVCCLYSNYKRQLHRSQPVKIVEAPVRALVPASLPPGSVHHPAGRAPSVAGSDGRVMYDWPETAVPMDIASYRSLSHRE